MQSITASYESCFKELSSLTRIKEFLSEYSNSPLLKESQKSKGNAIKQGAPNVKGVYNDFHTDLPP
jgi:hypothetical protein